MGVAQEPAHSPWGASAAERWLICSASINATKHLPDTDSVWATEGTACHTLSEWCRNEDKPTSYWLGEMIDVEQADGSVTQVEVTPEIATAVQEFVDFVNALEGHQLVEARVRYEEYVPGGYGTLDHAALMPRVGHVVDLKGGKGIQVFAKDNEQLMLYALGVYLDWDWIYGFEKFLLTIHQPRLDHVDTWEISVEDLLKWAREVLAPGYLRTISPQAEFVPGSHCRFCKIKSTCKARAAKTFEVLHGEFDNLDEFEPPQPGQLSNDQLAAARKHFPQIKAWMSAVDERLYAELGRGHKAGDLKLVAGRTARVWLGGEKIVVKALIQAGMTKEQLYEPASLRSPPALEKLVKNLAPRLKKTGKKGPGDLANLVNVIPGKPTIVDGDDERETISLSAANEFSNLDEEQLNG